MAITLGNVLKDVFGGGGGLGDMLFGSAGNDPTLTTALPAEANIRNKLNFANIRIQFPTTAGKTPISNILSSPTLSFPAYITSFSDKFSPSFTPVSVYGRTDAIPVYQGTSRSISIGLTIPCFDANDANENMKKINQFIKNLYPSYNQYKGDLVLSAPPLIRVKFANLIINHELSFKGLLGYVSSFDYSFTPSDGFHFDRSAEGATNLFFRSYTLTFSFNVLHESVIGFKNGDFNSSADYPYRVKNNLFNPIQAGKIKDDPAISKDINEAKLLVGG